MVIRLLTWNIAHGRGLSLWQGFHSSGFFLRNLSRIAELIAASRADVVALQEVDRDSHWNANLDLLEILRSATRHPFAELGVTNRRGGARPLLYGNGLLSHFPIRNRETVPFGNRTLGEKGFLWTEIELADGRLLPLVNLHLAFASRRRRIKQVELLVDRLSENIRKNRSTSDDRQYCLPIICGDFNSRLSSASDAVQHLLQHLHDHGGYRSVPRRARTFPSLLPAAGIDFVCVSREVKILRVNVLASRDSDHLPVFVELDL